MRFGFRTGPRLPRAIFFALVVSACGNAARPVVVAPPPIPADLLAPVAVRCPAFQTEGDVAVCLTRLRGGLTRANGQLAAIAEIVALGSDGTAP